MEAATRFEVNRVYKRDAILDEYGGQRYQGIVTPAAHPLVFIITGEAGLEHGYKDEMDDDGVFHYYGDGQGRDMEFSGGNAAILNHAENEEELHLFEKPRKNFWRYKGEMVCTGFRWETREMEPARSCFSSLTRMTIARMGILTFARPLLLRSLRPSRIAIPRRRTTHLWDCGKRTPVAQLYASS